MSASHGHDHDNGVPPLPHTWAGDEDDLDQDQETALLRPLGSGEIAAKLDHAPGVPPPLPGVERSEAPMPTEILTVPATLNVAESTQSPPQIPPDIPVVPAAAIVMLDDTLHEMPTEAIHVPDDGSQEAPTMIMRVSRDAPATADNDIDDPELHEMETVAIAVHKDPVQVDWSPSAPPPLPENKPE